MQYTYYKIGHVSNITIKDEYPGAGDPDDYDWYYDYAFYYTTAGRLWQVIEDRWEEDGGEPINYEKLSMREFYYDNPRQRYLTRYFAWDDVGSEWDEVYPAEWTDYAGMLPYGDFTTDANHAISEDKRYLAESGARVEQTVSTGATSYLHGDLLDSTMLATDAGGTAVSAVSYTAFGEPVGDPSQLGTRYGYAGGWGYESDLLTLSGAPNTASITLQHVGERWYQPGVGRFVQRDPIGIRGGLNTYAYVEDNPLSHVDPAGLVLYGPPSSQPGHTIDDLYGKLDEINERLKRIEEELKPKVEHCIIADLGYTAKGTGVRLRTKIPINPNQIVPPKGWWENFVDWVGRNVTGGPPPCRLHCFCGGDARIDRRWSHRR